MNARSKFAGFLLFSVLLFSLAWTASPPPLVAQDVVVSAAVPDNAPQATVNLDVQIKGNGFKKGAIAKWYVTGTTNPGGVTVNSTAFVNSTALIANINVASGAQTGKFDIVVMLTTGRTGKGIELFCVTVPDPAIAYTLDGELWVMDANGWNKRLLLDDGMLINHYEPNWSPDGSQLVFSSEIQGYGIYIINKDGTGLQKIASSDGFLSDPVWSPVPLPDGQYKIAFSAPAPLDPDDRDLFLVNPDGTGLVNLTNSRGLSEFYPTWSPTADRLAAQRYLSGTGYNDLIVYQLDSNGAIIGETNLTDIPGGILNDAKIYSPDWSKTGEKIAVEVKLPGATVDQIWIIDAQDPTNPVQLAGANAVGGYRPTWSPDDLQIAFTGKSGKGKVTIYTMNLDGSALKDVGPATPRNWDFPDWRRCCPTCDVMCAP